ncbi:hypothetical protein EJ08DRAFT_321197 [Tothia fuscella]|uniref:histidine kinase n=1 Tax=Tothia fuscella TaxID=1048955 RepID=A0A9P4TX84_9PEZI|nr:hypothetical protein EJ08DRAFT_321197 [Tothia fuscella]
MIAMNRKAIPALVLSAPRSLVCHYNPGMVAAALIVSLLGSFTSTQLMSQARSARTLPAILIWTILGSLTFGFCATWCLHFLGMLSCEFDVPIGLDPLLTVLTVVLAVLFTFGALSTDLIQQHWWNPRRAKLDAERGPPALVDDSLSSDLGSMHSTEPLLGPFQNLFQSPNGSNASTSTPIRSPSIDMDRYTSTDTSKSDARATRHPKGKHRSESMIRRMLDPLAKTNTGRFDYTEPQSTTEPPDRFSRESTLYKISTVGDESQWGGPFYDPNHAPVGNVLVSTAQAVLGGFTLPNMTKAFIWSLGLTNMHFMGVKALNIPGGYVSLDPLRVILCGTISWSACCVGVILMAGMEVNITQQLLFSVISAAGVAAKHFTGMYACSFWSSEAPSSKRGYPIELPIVIACVAVFTCMASTGLLAHTATLARDKLAEVLITRRRLWAAIAQKENAEAAAAARSEFIASASHEIRTPLHQISGYADILSKSHLSKEDRQLLVAIQHATRSLTMITSNVLDWSRIEKGEAICRPVSVDLRQACERIVHVLPNCEDNMETELFVVVAPEVPPAVLIDETFLQRILMNLLSNSFKFTVSGYVMLLLNVDDGILHATVRDSGAGIPTSFLPQLFEPYKQVQARGAERGTGLGLSIVKGLLRRMQGTIEVHSKYKLDYEVGAANSGTVFSITVPAPVAGHSWNPTPVHIEPPLRITIMHDGKKRAVEGLTNAWVSFGAEVSHAKTITDVTYDQETIIWVDLVFLRTHPDVSKFILEQQDRLVLVAYRNKVSLSDIIGTTPAPNFIPIRKPLIWHRIVQTIIDAKRVRLTPDSDRLTMGFDIVHAPTAAESASQTPKAKMKTILLVEDNKINQKLGAKMLKMLNYDVLFAENGQEAIDIVLEHGATIDAILMDQCMPRKDGIAATKEIREFEASGRLKQRQIIIAVTAAAGPESRALFEMAGADVFLAKPLSLTKLEETLARYWDRVI